MGGQGGAHIQGPGRRAVLAGLAAGAAAGLPRPGVAAPGGQAAYRWRSVKVGGGGFIPAILFSPVEQDLAYARSDMGGVYRWDAARAAWLPLQDDFAQSGAFGVESLAPDPVDPRVVYAAVGMYAHDPAMILRSEDRGATWARYPVAFRMGGNEPGRGLGERLAVDPNNTAVLYFGSRHDGLQRSLDKGRTWRRVEGFPAHGLGLPKGRREAHAGISFVVVDRAGGLKDGRSAVLYAGLADPGEHHLFRSQDGGESWRPVAGEPRADLLPAKAELDGQGRLFVTYGNGVGPNGVTDGAVWRLDTRSGVWTDITPDRGPGRPPGGYMGVSVSRSRPGVVVVASLNRWKPGDDIWRSADGGETWKAYRQLSTRDVSASPFLEWGEGASDFGWWMAGLAIDPFDADHVVYTTGATVYATRQASAVERGGPVAWAPWVEGIEQTAILTLTSPPQGPALLSGFGDIGGFAHEDLARSPATMFASPVFNNTNSLDYAGQAPQVVVRSGVPHAEGGPILAWSEDGGRHWSPLAAPLPRGVAIDPDARSDPWRDAAIIVSADGAVFMVLHPRPLITGDRGRRWRPVRGLPAGLRPIADRVDPGRFHALDFESGAIWTSSDGGVSFVSLPTRGLPAGLRADRPTWREDAWPLKAEPGRAGGLWLVSRQGLFRSVDGGRSFAPIASDLRVEMLDFGKPPAGRRDPALFAIGRRGELRAVWRSDDGGRAWIRVNDAAHEYGRRFRCIAGDPRVFGRVYVGTDGRGILYGEPAH